MSKKLPPMNRVPESLSERPTLPITEYGVASWCPTPDGSGPALVAGLGALGVGLMWMAEHRCHDLPNFEDALVVVFPGEVN